MEKTKPRNDGALQEQGEVGRTNSNPRTDYTENDRFSGWHLLGENARYRQQKKREWKRGRK